MTTIKSVLLKCIGVYLIVSLIDDTIHDHYYDMVSETDCSLYENDSPDTIIKKFDGLSSYTRWNAAGFLTACENKNVAPLILNNLKIDKNKPSNLIDFYFGTSEANAFPIGLANLYFNSIFPKKITVMPQDVNETTMIAYWSQEIESQIGYKIK